MMDTLFIRIPSPGALWQGWLQREQGVIPLADNDLASLFSNPDLKRRVVLLAPATACLMTVLPVNRQQMRHIGAQEILYMLEEQSLTPIEQLHVVWTPLDDERIQVAAIAHAQLQALLEPFRRDAQCELIAAVPDIFLLPANPGGWSLTVDVLDCWLRTGPVSGYRLEASHAAALLDAAYMEGAPGSIRVYGDVPEDVRQWLEARRETIAVEQLPAYEWPLSFPEIDARHPLNFLQGEYAVKTESSLSGHWRYAAIFVGIALVAQWAYDGLRLAHFSKVGRQSQAEAVQLYRTWYPEEGKVINLRRQLEGHLADSQRAGQGFMPLMTRVGETLSGGDWQTRRIDYDNNGLLLEVDAGNLTDVDRLRQQLSAQGLNTETLSAGSQGNGIRGRLRINGNS